MSNKSYADVFSLRGKVAVVTGGAGLIGREIARAYMDFGARVFVADVMGAKERVLSDPAAEFIELDIASEESIMLMIETVLSETGRLDVLVNSAYPRTKDWGLKFENIPASSLRENLNTQLGGCFLCCQKVAEAMKKTGNGGSIINIGSIYGMVAPDFSIYEGTEMTMPATYSAIKGGVTSFSRYLATYYAPHSIRVNVLSLGGVFDNQPVSFVERYSKKTPLGRMARPSEMVGAMVFLASEAASYVTGSNLVVDGGWTAW